MNQELHVGDSIQFQLGNTPMTGTILFAVGTNAAAVKLNSGNEIIIDLGTVRRSRH